jgi:UPF0176 protein
MFLSVENKVKFISIKTFIPRPRFIDNLAGKSRNLYMSQVVVSALYHFVTLDNYQALRKPLYDFMVEHEIRGTLLLAQEGINGTVAGSRSAINNLHQWLRSDERLKDLRSKESFDDSMPFYRTRVKLKKEIVTMGVTGIDPNRVVGTYVKPEDWNDLISDPEVTLIDTRNDYEVAIGTFKNAINPDTETFRQFPGYVKNNMDTTKHKKVAMFCTGGIRCEKSTAYLKEQGFEEVYHLQGGILKYLETVPEDESLWQGECEKYEQGVSCPACYDNKSEKQRKRFAERERQVQLAQARGEHHIGSDVKEISQQRKHMKDLQREKNRRSSLVHR